MSAILAYLPPNIILFCLLLFTAFFGLFFLFQIKRTYWIIYALIIWFPFESLILQYAPIDYYAYIKYIPELLLYSLTIGAWVHYIRNARQILPKNPLNKWFVLFVLFACISLILNQYEPFVWLLGMRQILRFGLIFFVLLFLRLEKPILIRLLYLGGVMILFQAVLGLLQYAAGGRLDAYLFSTAVVNIGNTAVLGGIEQFWTPGSRVFATMGRYDRLGSLLAIGLSMLFPFLYVLKKQSTQYYLYWVASAIGILALVLTYSRASWIGYVAAVMTMGIILMKDKRIMIAVGAFAACMIGYIGMFVMVQENVSHIVETPNQSIPERMLEAVSLRAWRESYEGYGRIFFIINTPRMVVQYHPFFGVGPGNYGGGVAAALLNTETYDRLKMPFGIENKYGQIDNSWMSLWGELGTIGLLAYIALWGASIRAALYVRQRQREKNILYIFATGLVGTLVGYMVIGFFGPYFEFRTQMFYIWILIGIMVLFWREEKKKGDFLTDKWE
ncbi:O-antigen ligase family protein [Patescibacteria group bacterium]|nr:O-antigen ligase family protein [Patescibacteria group bacterium]MBU1721853.1 O-antigen ligase family protein [Patescibacteria group bacterium]MBU1901311.1 O-antigen ligase family protein [Patescibacteria group bacterium]